MSPRLLPDAADVARARAVLAGTLQPVEPRFAGTVLLLRDGVTGLEVFLVRRQAAMPFAPDPELRALLGGRADSR